MSAVFLSGQKPVVVTGGNQSLRQDCGYSMGYLTDRQTVRVSVWIAVVMTTTTTSSIVDHFDIVTLSSSSMASSQMADMELDCRQVAAMNLTINVTDIQIHPGDILYLYHTLYEGIPKKVDILFIDLSVVKKELLHVLLSSSLNATNISVVNLERYENSPYEWCCLTSTYGLPAAIGETAASSPHPYSSLHDPKADNVLFGVQTKKARVIQELVSSMRWESVLLLYQNDYVDLLRSTTDLMSKANILYRIAAIDENAKLEENIMKTFESSDAFRTVVISSFDKAKFVLDLAFTLEAKLGKKISVAGSSQWLLMSQFGQVTPDSWLLESQFDNIALVCDPLDLTPQLGVSWQSDDLLSINTLMYTREGRRLSTVGQVTKDWTLTHQSDVFPNVKFGFNGRRFLVTTNPWPPYVYKEITNGTVTYRGFCMDLSNELSKGLNFTIEYLEPPDGGWGAVGPNGTWNGMVGQILRQEVDMIVAPIGVTGARAKVIDFTFAFFYDDTAVIMKKPDPERSKWRTYIDIFKKEVLICITASLVLGALVVFLVEWGRSFIEDGPTAKNFAKTYMGSFNYLLGAMLNQGGRNLPNSNASRIFLSSWWLFCLVVAGTYSGNLIAVLTVTKDKPPFDTVAEMASQDEYKFGTVGNSMWSTLFETSPRPEFQEVNRKMKAWASEDPNILALDPYVHLEKVKGGRYAYIADKGMFDDWLAVNCDLMLLKEKFFPAKYAIGLPNNSVYTKIFSDQVVKIYESGLLQVWIKRWWPKRSFCGGSLVTEAKTLTVVDMQSSFYLIGIGMGVGGLALLLEMVVARLAPQCFLGIRRKSLQDKVG